MKRKEHFILNLQENDKTENWLEHGGRRREVVVKVRRQPGLTDLSQSLCWPPTRISTRAVSSLIKVQVANMTDVSQYE